MPTAYVSCSRHAPTLEGVLAERQQDFCERLGADDSDPTLALQPVADAADSRVRVARLCDSHHAVVFRLIDGRGPAYLFYGVWPVEAALARARTMTLRHHPCTGVAEVAPASTIAASPTVSEPTTDDGQDHGLLGVSAATLVSCLGLAPELAATCLRHTTERDLVRALRDAVVLGQLKTWQSDAVSDLARGRALSTVQDEFGVHNRRDLPNDDASLVATLRDNPATASEFAWLEPGSSFTSALRAALSSDNFDSWRVWPHPSQKTLIDADCSGTMRISGGAGTGKTIVLLHRANRLHQLNPQARTLLTTFTRNIAADLGTLLHALNADIPQPTQLGEPGVRAAGIDAMVAAVLREAGRDLARDVEAVMGRVLTGSGRGNRKAGKRWQEAIRIAGHDLRPEHRHVAFLAAEYEMVILPGTITDEQTYLKVSRGGRGGKLSRPQRAAVWKVVEAYRNLARSWWDLDFAEAAMVATVHLNRRAANGEGRLFDHVIADEGQDLKPTHLLFLRALVAPGRNDIFVAEDSHQRIYGHKLVWSNYGLNIRGRSRRLTLNYRTTAENLRWGTAILAADSWTDVENCAEDTSEYRSLRSGPTPRLVGCASLSEQHDATAEVLRAWMDLDDTDHHHTLAVLVRTTWARDALVEEMAIRGVRIQSVESDAPSPGVPVVMTMHRSKGAEFRRVVMCGVSSRDFPRDLGEHRHDPDDHADALRRERSLLYVASTRARDELVVTWHGDRSVLVPDAPSAAPLSSPGVATARTADVGA